MNTRSFGAKQIVTVRGGASRCGLGRRLARLQPGSYPVRATLGDHALQQALHVSSGRPSRAVFVRPAGTDERNG